MKEMCLLGWVPLIFNLSSTSVVPPWTMSQIIWTCCFSLIMVTSIVGNTIVLWIICGK